MPTYEYECLKCERVFEHFQQISEAPLGRCVFDGCDGEVRRLVSAGAGVIFKGSGFYTTDYARSDNGSATRCGKERTCCGRDEPCASPPCHD